MNIAIIGYGKMGKEIEKIALDRNHNIVLKIDINNLSEYHQENMRNIDVAIEFTNPQMAYENVKKSIDWGVPIVCGTTGWLDRLSEIHQLCNRKNGSFIVASNFSVGVNIFFALNSKLSKLMAQHEDYEIEVKEVHHTEKKDTPSGTAISLAEQILKENDVKKKWTNEKSDKKQELSIISKREKSVTGIHSVTYTSHIDEISITHSAHNRKGFALGAVLAAEYIFNRSGIFQMKDVLGI